MLQKHATIVAHLLHPAQRGARLGMPCSQAMRKPTKQAPANRGHDIYIPSLRREVFTMVLGIVAVFVSCYVVSRNSTLPKLPSAVEVRK